ncbi:MAG TPA: hypothetical protein VIA81_10245 [Acidimicrobiia bacterium]|jgi:acyl dehydratase
MNDPITELQALVGMEWGPGPWLELTAARSASFARALDCEPAGIEPLQLLSLLPALLAKVELPVSSPRLTVNYGLDRMECSRVPVVGEKVRGRLRVTAVTVVAGGAQLQREAIIDDEAGNQVLQAHTLTRWLY